LKKQCFALKRQNTQVKLKDLQGKQKESMIDEVKKQREPQEGSSENKKP